MPKCTCNQMGGTGYSQEVPMCDVCQMESQEQDLMNRAKEQQAARIAALEAALQPFAACAEVWDIDDSTRIVYRARVSDSEPYIVITVADFLDAAAALK